MPNITLEGKVILIKDVETVGAKQMQKREFILETEEEKPQFMSIQIIGDKTSIIDNVELGEKIKAQCNLNGKSWVTKDGETKYFNSLTCWAINRTAKQQPVQPMSYVNQDTSFEDVPF